MNLVGSYMHWAQENPGKAQSLENMTRMFALSRTGVRDIVSAEMWWCIAKMHAYINKLIITSKGTSLTSHINAALHAIIGGMKLMECMLELLSRRRYGHKVAWDILLIWQSVKTCFSLIVNRDLFTFPSLKELFQGLQPKYLSVPKPFPHLSVIASHTDVFHKNVTLEGDLSQRVPEGMKSITVDGVGIESLEDGARHSRGEEGSLSVMFPTTGGSDGLSCDGRSPANVEVPLVVPRVVSSKLKEHTHYNLGSQDKKLSTLDNTEMEITKGSALSVATPATNKSVESPSAVPIKWLDVLGMLLDAYILFRPLLLVGVGRYNFLNKQRSDPSSVPLRPHELWEKLKKTLGASPSNLTDASKEPVTEEGGKANSSSRKKAKAAAADGDLALIRTVVEIPRQRSLFPSWKAWVVFLVFDLISIVLAGFVRRRRIPIVRIAQENMASVPPLLHSDSDADVNEDSTASASLREISTEERDAVTGTQESHRRHEGTTTTTTSEKTVKRISQDDRRVLQCGQMIRTSVLRDPFFTVGLKKWIFEILMTRLCGRIPLIGKLINYQLGYYFMMQHFSFMSTLDVS